MSEFDDKYATGAKSNFLSRYFLEFDVWKMWIFGKMRLWKCEFCEKWDFESVNFVKNDILKMWILSKIWLWKSEFFLSNMRLWKCEFCQQWDFQNVNFWTNCGFLPQCEK